MVSAYLPLPNPNPAHPLPRACTSRARSRLSYIEGRLCNAQMCVARVFSQGQRCDHRGGQRSVGARLVDGDENGDDRARRLVAADIR